VSLEAQGRDLSIPRLIFSATLAAPPPHAPLLGQSAVEEHDRSVQPLIQPFVISSTGDEESEVSGFQGSADSAAKRLFIPSRNVLERFRQHTRAAQEGQARRHEDAPADLGAGSEDEGSRRWRKASSRS